MGRSDTIADSQITYAVQGASYLWPWNTLITAGVFAQEKLKSNPTLAANYSSVVMAVSTLGSLSMSVWLATRPAHFAMRIRNGELVIGVAFMALSLACFVSLPPLAWFMVMLAVVAASSVGSSLVQNGVMALTQRIPGGQQARAVLVGQAVAGIVPPVLSLVLGPGKEMQARLAPVFFLSASVLALTGILLFKGPVIEQHVEMAEIEGCETPSIQSLLDIVENLRAPCVAIVLGFIVSLSYPVFANTVQSRVIQQQIYSSLTHLIWNSGDLAGRMLCEAPQFQIKRPQALVFYAVARFSIILTLISLVRAGNPSDVAYLGIHFLYGLTGGHLLSGAISLAPDLVIPQQQPAAGGLIGMMIAIGLALGAFTSFLIVPAPA